MGARRLEKVWEGQCNSALYFVCYSNTVGRGRFGGKTGVWSIISADWGVNKDILG